jgi:hypothetical protein
MNVLYCRKNTLSYVPSRGAIIALSSIMVSLAMTAHEQDLIHSIETGISIQRVHDLCELLPLGGISCTKARVGLVQKAEVDSRLHHRVRSISSAIRDGNIRSRIPMQQYPVHPAKSSQ